MLRERDFYVNDAYTNMPTTYESYLFLGRRRREPRTLHTTLDLAYRYVTNKQTQYHSSSAGPKTGGDMERGAVCDT